MPLYLCVQRCTVFPQQLWREVRHLPRVTQPAIRVYWAIITPILRTEKPPAECSTRALASGLPLFVPPCPHL